MTQPRSEDRILTIPNLISALRLVVLLPLVVWMLLAERLWIALGLIVLLSATDFLDGWVARRFGQVSLLGKRLDPVADRISIVVITLALVVAGVLPWPVIAIIALVDLVLLVMAIALFGGSPDLPVSRIGKWRTAALLLGLPALIIAQAASLHWMWIVGVVLVWMGVVGHVVAGYGYARGMVLTSRRGLERGDATRTEGRDGPVRSEPDGDAPTAHRHD